MNICFTSFIIREMRIKITMNHHYASIIMAQTKARQPTNLTVLSAGERIEQRGISCTGDWNEILYSYFGKEFVERKIYTYVTRTLHSGIHPREIKNCIRLYASVYCRFTHNHQKRKISNCSSPGNV